VGAKMVQGGEKIPRGAAAPPASILSAPMSALTLTEDYSKCKFNFKCFQGQHSQNYTCINLCDEVT